MRTGLVVTVSTPQEWTVMTSTSAATAFARVGFEAALTSSVRPILGGKFDTLDADPPSDLKRFFCAVPGDVDAFAEGGRVGGSYGVVSGVDLDALTDALTDWTATRREGPYRSVVVERRRGFQRDALYVDELFTTAAPQGEQVVFRSWGVATLGVEDQFIFLDVFTPEPSLMSQAKEVCRFLISRSTAETEANVNA